MTTEFVRSCIRRVAIALVWGTVAVACDRVPTAAPPPPLLAQLQAGAGGVGLVPCAPLPDAAVRQIVGPAGATIALGPHRLVIPPGALTTAHEIEAVIDQDLTGHAGLAKLPAGRVVQAGATVVNAVSFAPHLTFRKPARLTLSFANCDVEQVEAPRTAVVYTNRASNVIHEVLASTVDPEDDTVAAELEHFANYAVGW